MNYLLLFIFFLSGCATKYESSGIEGVSVQDDLALCQELAKAEAEDEKAQGEWFVSTKAKVDKCMQAHGHKAK